MKAKWMISVCLLLWASMDRTWAYDEHSQYEPFAPDGVPFCVADTAWDADGLGSHRAVVEVKETSLKAVRARYDAATGTLSFVTDTASEFTLVNFEYRGTLYTPQFYAALETYLKTLG